MSPRGNHWLTVNKNKAFFLVRPYRKREFDYSKLIFGLLPRGQTKTAKDYFKASKKSKNFEEIRREKNIIRIDENDFCKLHNDDDDSNDETKTIFLSLRNLNWFGRAEYQVDIISV